MKRKIGIAIMFGLICINILSGCGPSSNENKLILKNQRQIMLLTMMEHILTKT